MAHGEQKLSGLGKGMLLAGLCTGLVGIALPHPLLALLTALCASALLLSALPGWWIRRVRFDSPPALKLYEEEEAEVEFSFRLPPLSPIHQFEVKLRVDGCHDCFSTSELSLGREQLFRARWRGRSRGRAHALHVSLQTREPFGLWFHRLRRTVSCDLWVLPAPRTIKDSVLESFLRLRPRGEERADARRVGDGEFYCVKEHRPGEPEHRVHTKLSARRGHKVLRVHRAEGPPRVALVLDLERSSGSTGAFQEVDFEEALRFAAGLVRALFRRGVPVTLLASERRGLRLLAPPTTRDVFLHFAALALLQPAASDELDWEVEAQRLAASPTHGTRTVLLHTGPPRTVPHGWIALAVGGRDYYRLLETTRKVGATRRG